MAHRLLSAAFAALALSLSSTSALAWGDEGHKVVATIAYGLLSNSTKSKVDALLADDPVPAKCGSGSFVADAVWADKLRAKSRQCSSGIKWGRTSSWHFLDIPLSAKAYDHQRDCPKDDCVVAKIAYFRGLLADKAKSKARRRDALKFLIHFVGDLHQPLHTTSAPFDEHRAEEAEQEGARRNTCLVRHLAMDRGGNCVDVFDGRRKTELHAFWDTDVVKAISKNVDGAAAVAMKGVTAADIKSMQAGTIVDWTNESHQIAVKVVYADLPAGPMPQLKGAYLKSALGAAELQLRRGGVRLAKVIEDALR